MQTLLAIAFLHLGFKVIKNAIGVPDLIVHDLNGEHGYAIEVKTSKEKISLNQRELDAIKTIKHDPIVAYLNYPDINPRWYLLDARNIKKGTYEKRDLARRPKVMVDIDINGMFRIVLADYHWNCVNAPNYLNIIFGQLGGKLDDKPI